MSGLRLIPGENEGRPRSAWAVAVFLLAVGVYLNCLRHGFVYDDHFQIEANAWIRDFGHFGEIFGSPTWAFWGRGGSNYYRPLMHVANAVVYAFSGLDPFGYHLVNVLLHGVNAVLAFRVSLRLFRWTVPEKAVDPLPFALLSAALFAVHPIHAEVVAVNAALTELLFSAFFLLAFIVFPFEAAGERPGRERGMAAGSAILFFLSLLCKETGIMLLPLIAAVEFLRPDGLPRRNAFRRYIPFMACIGAYLALRAGAFGGLAPARSQDGWTLFKIAATSVFLAGRYVLYLLWPANLNFHHIVRPVSTPADPRLFVMVAIVAGCLGHFIHSLKKDRLSAIGWIFLFLPLVPVLYPPVLAILFGEHNLYLPSLGFSILASRLLTRSWSRPGTARFWAMGAAGALLVSLSVMTVSRNPVFANDESLWTDVGKKSGDASPIHFQRGYWLMEEGRLQDGIAEMEAALSLRPDYPDAHYNIGIAYVRLGRDDEAGRHLEIAVKANGADSSALFELAALHYRQGRIAESVREYEAVLKLDPSFAEARGRLEMIRARHGKEAGESRP